MSLSRRDFVRAGTTAAFLQTLPHIPLLGQPHLSFPGTRYTAHAHRVDPDQMRTLALRAVDAARAAGAVYADVRLTRSVSQRFDHKEDRVVRAEVSDRESLGFGVRALVNGYWGFAASPYWDADEAIELAQAAVSQAKTNALGLSRVVEWTPIPAVTGTWVAPGTDPFSIPVEEKIEFMNAWRQAIADSYLPPYTLRADTSRMQFLRQEWYMASTEGAAVAQTFYTTSGKFQLTVNNAPVTADGLQSQQGGWEIVLDAKLRDQIPVMVENAARRLKLSSRPVDIGRNNVVFDANTSASLLGNTIGLATQLDRALGLEANAGGTSYLGPDPMTFLGTTFAGAPLITITANRSMPKGNATVQWDDEGVRPDEFSLVKDGLLVDYQTTREQAPWIKRWYAQQHRPVQSHGCAIASSALDFPVQQTPNLVLQHGTTAASFESLISGTKKGYAVLGGWASTDFQAKNGIGSGFVREIVNGTLGDVVESAGFLFDALELWKNVTALGDPSSVQLCEAFSGKGQPGQVSLYTIAAVPMVVKNVSIIDIRRRA